MTIFAFPFLYFVKYIGVLLVRDFFMAFYASNILMLSVQFKGSCVMIKVINLPSLKIMTFQTVCHTIIFKLFKVYILVATGTGR